ncbi:MAG TPA: hypothetical protein VFD30_17930 [Terriglobia bacterium]|nr:hypothetical protein [Terriglobia bacterium]
MVEIGAWADGSVVRGKFRIVSKVDQSGMGPVYKAVHLDFGELRALKVISKELMTDEVFVKRFIEGQSLKKLIQVEGPLSAPRVCAIYPGA